MKRILSFIVIIGIMVSLIPARYTYAEEYTPTVVEYYNGHKYALYDTGLTWHEAKAYCESIGGHLVTITSAEEQNFVENFIKLSKIKKCFWIGAYTDNNETFRWVTKELFLYNNWNINEPSFYWDGIEESSVIMQCHRAEIYGKWNDTYPYGDTNSLGVQLKDIYFICEWEDTSTANDYIIQQVSKYTSEDLYNAFDFILSSSYSDDVKLQALNEVASSYGLTDPREGVKYLSDTTAHRMNYRYLTTDEIYCAYNFGRFIATDLAARSALYIDGLIFNNEVNDYIGIVTGTEADTPGVQKYKQMLNDFITDGNFESEVLTSGKKISNFLDKILEINGIDNDNLKKDSMNISVNTSKNKQNTLIKKFSESLLKTIGVGKSLKLKGGDFSMVINDVPDILTFTLNTAEDLVAIANMKEQIEIYSQYSNFLKAIYQNTDVTGEMRIAAKKLYDEIEKGYLERFKSILRSSIDLTSNIFDVNILKSVIGELGADAFKTINLAAYIVNTFVNVGDFVRQAAYTQGYAELSALYSIKLRQDAANFRANKTSANAWQFFEDYNLLWKLRYKGEEQFLEMSSIKGIFNKAEFKEYNYSAKENMVYDTLKRLNKSKFEYTDYELPQSVQYLSKSVMSCPVNVYVYNQKGELIAELIDGVESDITNSYGRFAVVYKPYTNEYAKIVCQSTDEKLTIKAEAISDGLVNYETANTTDDMLYTFDNVNISKGNIISTEDTSGYKIYNDENDEIGTEYILNEINTDLYIPVEGISINNKKELTLNMGEHYVFDVSLMPSNASNRRIEWISDNENALIVQNGVATALREGSATVYARATDSYELIDSMEISIAPADLTLTADNVKVNSSIGELIVAGYNDNELIKVETINGYESELSGYEACEYIKAFLWYTDKKGLSALCDSQKIILTK